MKIQALGWLAAGVLAAGLNASYHNGGLEWAHRIANQVSHNTNAVLALATGNADRLYTEARLVQLGEERSPCPLSLAMAQMKRALPNADVAFAQFDRMSDREKARLARFAARRTRMQAQLVRVELPAVLVNRVAMRVPDVHVCPRVRVRLPRIPEVKVPAMPQVHVEVSGAGPV
ncbi:MAG TPA: hypothetical protein VHW45_14265 [Candidatus Sulfotelmatobacter sp.]|nr:hypothetical protein [Candidatus Sulfotelmatobacter sp.]